MARAADFFEIFKNNMRHAEADQRMADDIRGFFDDLLLDPEFDEVGDIEDDGAEFHLYRESHDQPESFQ